MTRLIAEKELKLVNKKSIQKNGKEHNILEFANIDTYDKYTFFTNKEVAGYFVLGEDYYLKFEIFNYRGQTRFALVGAVDDGI